MAFISDVQGAGTDDNDDNDRGEGGHSHSCTNEHEHGMPHEWSFQLRHMADLTAMNGKFNCDEWFF